jgi:hypothetical protein
VAQVLTHLLSNHEALNSTEKKKEQELTNRIISNSKASAHQRKQLSESRDNPQNRRESLPALQWIKE